MCVFKDVMGCTGAHPPWLCKVFRKLAAQAGDAWAAQNGEMEAGVHRVEVSETREDQCKKVIEAKSGSEQPEGGGLLVEGEEQEYFLEHLIVIIFLL